MGYTNQILPWMLAGSTGSISDAILMLEMEKLPMNSFKIQVRLLGLSD